MFEPKDKKVNGAIPKSTTHLITTITSAQFLEAGKRQALLHVLQELSLMNVKTFEQLTLPLIHSLIDYCQNLPESENSYYAQPGGIIDFALNRTEAALQLFRQFLVINHDNAYSEIQKLWIYVMLSASLLKDIGKLRVDYQIETFSLQRQLIKTWNPLMESLISAGHFYHYEFIAVDEEKIALRRRINLILAYQLMPAKGFEWIASNAETLAAWLALLSDDWHGAGTLGAILVRADAAAMLRYFNEHLTHHPIKRSPRIGTFVDTTIETTKEQILGVEFIKWLTSELESGEMIINQLPIHLVPGGLLLSPEAFKLFVNANPQYRNWQAVQSGFLSLGLHQKNQNGSPMSQFEQMNTHKTHEGILFNKYAIALPASVKFYNLYTGKIAPISAIELIHLAQVNHLFSQKNLAQSLHAPQHLTATGEWKTIPIASGLKPGMMKGG